MDIPSWDNNNRFDIDTFMFYMMPSTGTRRQGSSSGNFLLKNNFLYLSFSFNLACLVNSCLRCHLSWSVTNTRVVRTGVPRAQGGRGNAALIRVPFLFIILGTVALGGLNATRWLTDSIMRMVIFCLRRGYLRRFERLYMFFNFFLCFCFSGLIKRKRLHILLTILFFLDPQPLSGIIIHIIFCKKERKNILFWINCNFQLIGAVSKE